MPPGVIPSLWNDAEFFPGLKKFLSGDAGSCRSPTCRQ